VAAERRLGVCGGLSGYPAAIALAACTDFEPESIGIAGAAAAVACMPIGAVADGDGAPGEAVEKLLSSAASRVRGVRILPCVIGAAISSTGATTSGAALVAVLPALT